MANELRFDGKVAIITGAGNGLGRSHALLLASRGAKVVVNDLGGAHTGGGKSSAAADKVVAEIKAAGGEAVANYDSVEDGKKIVQCALDSFKRVDIVVNNAGILRDVSFHKMTEEDWDLIYRVHVLGAFRVTHAAWPHLRDQEYGRVIVTASAAGIYGNFGQANYSMAKLGLVGFANSLAIEGKKKNVHVNAIAPIAGSRMTATILPPELIEALKPEYVSPLVAWLCHDSCQESGGLFEVGGGFFSKLRWERTEGKMFRPGRAIPLEAISSNWGTVVDFGKATHPTDVTNAMQPVLANAQQGPSKGGNELIDVDAALGFEFPEVKNSYDERDLAIYALGVGAAANPADPRELQLVYENFSDGFKALPSYGVIPALNCIMKMAKEGVQAPGMNYGFERILHGEQYLEVKRPLPPKATLTHRIRVKDIFDKGKNALVVTEIKSYDESGEELIRNELTSVIRGAGGWGGDRGPSVELNVAPERAPDATVTEKIHENQALLYRLSGDWNPLHVDPNFATAFGFQRPILHGLCTFGYAVRQVLKTFAKDADPRFFKSVKVRFADSVFPGETLVTEMWKESPTRILFRCRVKERPEKPVISNAAVELYEQIPAAVAAKKPAAPAGASAPLSLEPISADIFQAIEQHIAKSPELVGKVATVYQWKLSNPASAWTMDLKNGKGSVKAGEVANADCTLELSDADFLAMCTGKADPQKLYMGGKLKIGGNLMASMKLEFLKKIDPASVVAIVKARAGAGGGAAAPAAEAAAPAAAEPSSREVFGVIGGYIAQHPELVGKVATVYQWNINNPASTWTLDLKNGAGSVAEGAPAKADCTLDISEADFLAMCTGKADPQKLFFGGKLKITGNVMASQKLEFLKQIDPTKVKPVASAAPKTAPAAAPAASPGPSPAEIFAKLGDRVSKNGGLVKEVGAVVLFQVPNVGDWTVDLKSGSGSVKQGSASKADATITLAPDDLVALAKGESPQVLFQKGRLRVDGDVLVARRLGFLKQLV